MPKKSKKNKGSKPIDVKVRDLELAEAMEEYGKITALLGSCRFTVRLTDNSERMAIVHRGMRRTRLLVDSVVLVSKRSFQENKVDVIHKYTDDEIRKLIQYKEIPEVFGRPASSLDEIVNTTDGVVFEEASDDIDFDDI